MRTAIVWAVLAAAFAAGGCSLGNHYPEGRIACASASDCPRDWTCRVSTVGEPGLCYHAASAANDAGTDTLDAQTPRDGGVGLDAHDAAASERDAQVQGQDAATRDANTVSVSDAGPNLPDASTVDVPKIDAVTVGNRYLNPDQQTSISCLATDPNADPLSYAWSATAGEIAAPMQKSTSYLAGLVGPADVSCRVTNTKGGSASALGSVRVYPRGWLTLLRFSLDSSDLSGHGNAGTVTNGSYGSDRAGNTGSALQLEGTGVVTLPNPSTFALDEWSFVATLSPSPGHGGTIVSKGTSAFGSFTLFLYADNDPTLPGRLQYYQASSTTPYTDVLGSFSAQGNSFFQLAVTRSKAGELRAYIDGTLIASASGLPDATQNDAPVLLGNGPLGAYWGVIDEVQIYDHALIATEVMALVGMQ